MQIKTPDETPSYTHLARIKNSDSSEFLLRICAEGVGAAWKWPICKHSTASPARAPSPGRPAHTLRTHPRALTATAGEREGGEVQRACPAERHTAPSRTSLRKGVLREPRVKQESQKTPHSTAEPCLAPKQIKLSYVSLRDMNVRDDSAFKTAHDGRLRPEAARGQQRLTSCSSAGPFTPQVLPYMGQILHG